MSRLPNIAPAKLSNSILMLTGYARAQGWPPSPTQFPLKFTETLKEMLTEAAKGDV